jgi:hypothetical protein
MCRRAKGEKGGNRWSRESRSGLPWRRSRAKPTSLPAWQGSFQGRPGCRKTISRLWHASGFGAGLPSGYPPAASRTGKMRQPPARHFWTFSGRLRIGLEQRRNDNGRVSWTYASRRRHEGSRDHAERPPERECQARASSIPVSPGHWPMPDVGHSCWGCSSSILRRKHNRKPKSIFWRPMVRLLLELTMQDCLCIRCLVQLRSSLLLNRALADTNACTANTAPTPLSEQYEEPSIPSCAKLRAE